MTDRIGFVGVGDLVTLAPTKRAPLYRVDRITDRWIHLERLDEDHRTRSIPVSAWRSISTVPWHDPRRPENQPCGPSE